MKIVNSIYQIYNEQIGLYEKLKSIVDEIIKSTIPSKWHYASRLKSIESYAIKLETGRIYDAYQVEDLLGCTIVVENINEIKRAKGLLINYFAIDYQRPLSSTKTSKDSYSFVFDDLRYYVKLKSSSASEKGPINNIVFEIQIKTYLQHAWAIATHDLIYKSSDICWAKQRVAYQVKAMLENAEVSISKAARIKRLPGLPEENDVTIKQKKVREFLVNNWEQISLPADITRLVENILTLQKCFGLSLERIQEILDIETGKGGGRSITNLTPYLIVIQCIINQEPKIFINFLRKSSTKKILITQELDLSLVSNYLASSNNVVLMVKT